MNIALGVSWNDSKKRRLLGAIVALIIAGALVGPLAPSPARASGRTISVVVVGEPGKAVAVEREVERLGGRIERRIGIIDGVAATIPAGALARLERTPVVRSVSANRPMRPLHSVDGYDASTDANSMFTTHEIVGSRSLHSQNITGAGIDVALIDTGVVAVKGLSVSGKVLNGPDLSFESQSDQLRYLDTFGHGTHMAGIIAGRDETASVGTGDHDNFIGIAPGARLLNLKVANVRGVTDVSQVIAAIDWVVQNRNRDGLNVRVLNLSFGTDGTQDYTVDPLTYAVEVAWRRGIVVVVAAGNEGYGSTKLNNPAYDPYVIAVGAADPKGTRDVSDDVVPSWSSRGDGTRNPDLVAPGKSMVSLRVQGSYIDHHHPEGRVNSRFFRGSGTSQAAAVVSGCAALILQGRPTLTPDQVKALLTSTARKLPAADATAQGAGELDCKAAAKASIPTNAAQTWPQAQGTGSLDQARGSARVADENGNELNGERDIFGAQWDGNSWSKASWEGNSWSGGTWNGNSWSGNSWSGNSWSSCTWSGNSWSGNSWSGNSWSGNSWSGNSWSGNSWSGNSWSGNSWSGNSWSGNSWS